jgi:hypothetical protein
LNRAAAENQIAIIDDALNHPGNGATGVEQTPELAN